MTREWTSGHSPEPSPHVLGAHNTSGAIRLSRSFQVYTRSSFFQTILPLPCQAVQKIQIWLPVKLVHCWCSGYGFFQLCLFSWLSLLSLFQVLLGLRMHLLLQTFTFVGIALLVKVMLVGGQRLLTLPFHVIDEITKP